MRTQRPATIGHSGAGSNASSSASTIRSATPPPTKRVKRSETVVCSTGQEDLITKVINSCETVVKAEGQEEVTSCETLVKAEEQQEEEDFEDNPYDLKDDAQKWLEEDMKPFGPEGYLVDKTCYRPHLIGSNSSISDEKLKKRIQEHLEKAGAEYGKRVKKADAEKIKKPIQPVLVLLGVSKKMMGMLNEQDALGFGQFLYFPTLRWNGDQGALFMTYMPGPAHGFSDTEFTKQAGVWVERNDLDEYLLLASNTGGYGKKQPDLRILPRNSSKDSQGNDEDRSNDNTPHSRFYWEIEDTNRDIIGLRVHGKKLMTRTEYTRLFAGCKFTGPTAENPTTFEAAVVLWGKNDANEIEVLSAIDFGSRELIQDSKDEWSKDLASMLPPVPETMWNRPADAGERPWKSSSDVKNPEPEWVLQIPIESLLYKVTAYESDEYLISPSAQRGGRYVLDGTEVTDLEINIKKIARNIAEVKERKKSGN